MDFYFLCTPFPLFFVSFLKSEDFYNPILTIWIKSLIQFYCYNWLSIKNLLALWGLLIYTSWECKNLEFVFLPSFQNVLLWILTASVPSRLYYFVTQIGRIPSDFIATISSLISGLWENPIYLLLKIPSCLSFAMSLHHPCFNFNPRFTLE